MSAEIPIKIIDGVELHSHRSGIATVMVTNAGGLKELSWDRYVRLKASAQAAIHAKSQTILDAGGYDGAIGFFLPGVDIDLIDPATTGGSVLSIPADDRSYDAVVAVDVLEHIAPTDRAKAISEFSRVARKHVVLNYPCQDSKEAQEVALKLTNNSLIREHVEWELPDSNWVLSELGKAGFQGSINPHTSIAVWLGLFVTLNLVPDSAKELNQHLIENYAEEPCSRHLYHLVVCERTP